MPTYIGTPRTVRKQLFPSSTMKKYKSTKRMYRRVNGRLVRKSSKKRPGIPRKSLKATLQNMLLDPCFAQIDISSSAKRNWQEHLLGSGIIQGGLPYNRLGNVIHVKGIDIRGIYYNSNPATVGDTIATAPTHLHLYLIRTDRADGVKGYFYQHPIQLQGTVNYDDPFGTLAPANTAAGDAQRTKLRINTGSNDLKIIWQKTITVGSRANGSPQDYTSRVFKYYINLNNIKLEYETISNAGNYAAGEIRPAIWLVWFQSQPDVAADDTKSNASMTGRYTIYYKA